jgi:hypothetical protein
MAWQVHLSGEIHTDWRERIDRAALAVAREPEQVVDVRRYVTEGVLS